MLVVLDYSGVGEGLEWFLVKMLDLHWSEMRSLDIGILELVAWDAIVITWWRLIRGFSCLGGEFA